LFDRFPTPAVGRGCRAAPRPRTNFLRHPGLPRRGIANRRQVV
jgi:hypothetical protein